MEQDNQKDMELSTESSVEISLAEQMGLDAKAAIELGLDDEEIAKLGLDIQEVNALKRKMEGAEELDSSEIDVVEEIGDARDSIDEEVCVDVCVSDVDVIDSEMTEELQEVEQETVKEIVLCESEAVMDNIKEYINNDSCNIIFAVTDKLLESSTEDEEIAGYLRGADLLIASSELKNTEEAVDGDQDGLDIHLITQIASEEEIGKISVMLMTEDREISEKFEQKMHGLFEEKEYLEFVGNYVVEQGTDDDSIINEINSALPDVLVSACKTPYQEKWLLENKSKMCAKLVIALSGEKEEFLQKKESGMGIIARIFGKLR